MSMLSAVHASPDRLHSGSCRRDGPSDRKQELTMQNIVILAGNIGQKPEVRATQSSTKITNFTLATSRPRR